MIVLRVEYTYELFVLLLLLGCIKNKTNITHYHLLTAIDTATATAATAAAATAATAAPYHYHLLLLLLQ